jgi:hypothetical protein
MTAKSLIGLRKVGTEERDSGHLGKGDFKEKRTLKVLTFMLVCGIILES